MAKLKISKGGGGDFPKFGTFEGGGGYLNRASDTVIEIGQ